MKEDMNEKTELHPNHLPDLRYVLMVLERCLAMLPKSDGGHGEVSAAITGMRYIIKRTEEAAASPSSKSTTDLHAAIMNLPSRRDCHIRGRDTFDNGYEVGHRDARHAAAELALASSFNKEDGIHEQKLWLNELFTLIEKWNSTRDGTPSKAEAWNALWKHSRNIGPHWRAREYLASSSIKEDGERAEPVAPLPYTDAIGRAGQEYHRQFEHAHPLPALWRWQELWDRMVAASSPPSPLGDDK